MHYLALFCHAYKNLSKDKFRIVYKIYDPRTNCFASVYRGPVTDSSTCTANTPHCKAVMMALMDPYLDTVRSDTVICVFNIHRLIHTVIDSFVLGKPQSSSKATPGFMAACTKLRTMLDRTRTVSSWLDVKDESNPLRDVLVEFIRFNRGNEGEWSQKNTTCTEKIRAAIESEVHLAVTHYYDHITRAKNQRDLDLNH